MISDLRIGNGYDVHRVDSSRPLVLGGVHLKEGPGLLGHSDADVVLHALMDALLGATGQDDIGVLFPNTSPKYSGADSGDLLKTVLNTMSDWRVINVDITLVAERPKIAPYRSQIRSSISQLLNIDSARVGFKATTKEGLGAIGRGEGIEAYAVVLLVKQR
jgi:2-C-methyl-D-erythritol 2,4-cyclodiphosphate synthase